MLSFNHTTPGSMAAPACGAKHLHDPTLGTVRYESASFQANDDPALKLALYTRRRGSWAG